MISVRFYDPDAKQRYREAARLAQQQRRHGPTGRHGRRQTARERRALRRRGMRAFEKRLRRMEARGRKQREARC